MTAGINCNCMENGYRFRVFLLKTLYIFLANVDSFWLAFSFSFTFMILIQSNTGKKNSEARAEDQMLNRLGMSLLHLFSLMATSFCLMLSYTPLTPVCVFQEFPVIAHIFPLTLENTDFKH